MKRALCFLIIFSVMASLAWPQEAGVKRLLVRGDHGYPPYEFLDDRGKPAGFNIDLIRAVSEAMGLEIDIELGPWNEVRHDLEQGRIDIVSGMIRSQARDRSVDFSSPFIVISHSIFVRKGSPIQALTDVRDKEILVQQGEIMHDFVLSNRLSHRISTVDKPLDALRILSSGRYDCALLDELQGLYEVRMHGLANIVTVGGPLGPGEYCFAVREGDTALASKLNEGLRIVISSGKYGRIYNKWFGPFEEERFARKLWRYAGAMAVPFTLILAAVLIWLWMLKRAVAAKTAELEGKVKECEQAENMAHESGALYRAIFENTGTASTIINNDTIISPVNTQWTVLTGYSKEECEGKKSWTEFVVEEDLARMRAYHAARRQEPGGAPSIYEFRLKDRSGRVHDCVNHVTMIPGTDRSVASVMDITERKKAEAALREARDKLEERVRERTADLQNANEELKKFAYFVSHDLRAPLINLKGFSAELRTTMEQIRPWMEECLSAQAGTGDESIHKAFNEEIPEALNFIEASVSRMDNLINAVLQLSRAGLRDLVLEMINMNVLVDYVIKSMEHQITASGTQVTVDELPYINADRTSMEQIMANLIDNAMKYLSPDRKGEIHITGEPTDESFIFHVRDNGRGIAPQDVSRIFELFRRVGEQNSPGYGMGLNYVQTLIRRHGGRIWCESEPGSGTTFSFTIAREVVTQEGENND